ncbi:replication initiation protein [Paenibacillus sp. MER 78]|uniref:replication initiation protein n=1 Tax=Paenibacillus sp. MER 78 TaxID=2939571 RepID=UPI00203C939C|nr:replication initiation protein [Paenibacillus sp. MER 78]MCM3130560.1 replication initiation protein [Paenibacillus sp. MER 78]
MKAEQLEFDLEPTSISPEYIVTKSNALIEMPLNLDLQESRVIYTLISLIQPDDEDFKTHFVKVKEFADILDLQEKNFYKKIREVVTGLQRKTLVIRENNGESELVVNWLSASRYHHRKGVVELEFSPQLKPYLLKLKKDFTRYKLANVLVLRSKYSIRMYELLKRYLNFGKRRFTLEQLRNLLEIEPGKLTHYGHLKQRVLLKTQEELAEKTDISFDFEETKVGHKVVAITCYIKQNHRNKLLQKDPDLFEEGVTAISLLTRFGVRKSVAEDLLKTFGEKRVKANIQYVYETKQEASIDNISGYMVKAIREDFVNNGAGYEEEDLYDFETSIPHLNARLRRLIENHQEKMDQAKKSEEKKMRSDMTQAVVDEIHRTLEIRRSRNLRPLDPEDFEQKYVRELYEYLLEHPYV